MIWWILLTLWVAGIPYYLARNIRITNWHDLWHDGWWWPILKALLIVVGVVLYPLGLWWALLSLVPSVRWDD